MIWIFSPATEATLFLKIYVYSPIARVYFLLHISCAICLLYIYVKLTFIFRILTFIFSYLFSGLSLRLQLNVLGYALLGSAAERLPVAEHQPGNVTCGRDAIH